MLEYPRIFISAGEHSGDRIGAGLAAALKRQAPDVQLCGLGGARMAAEGVEIVADTTRHAGMGLVYVLKHLGDWARVYRCAAGAWNRQRPDIVVPIDNPGFNLGKAWFGGISGLARERGIPVCYYVSPQVWAWWPWRIHRICRLVDRMMTILPFEKKLYDDLNTDCRYVGHPTMEYLSKHELDQALLDELAAEPGPVVGLLPGSRGQELRNTFRVIGEAAKLIQKAMPDVRLHVAAVTEEYAAQVREKLIELGLDARVHVGKTPEIMKASRLVLACSGTATLETAFFRTPMVICYRALSWHKHLRPFMLNIENIGLVNIVAGKKVVPEFLKFDDDATPVADAALTLLRDKDEWQACRDRLETAMQIVGGPGSFERAARAVLELVGR